MTVNQLSQQWITIILLPNPIVSVCVSMCMYVWVGACIVSCLYCNDWQWHMASMLFCNNLFPWAPSLLHSWVYKYIPYIMQVLRQKSFTIFVLFACPGNFLYESSRWHCSCMDLRESMRGSAKVFLQRSLCTTGCETFWPQNFHSTQYAYSYVYYCVS